MLRGEEVGSRQWREVAEEIREDILTHGVSERGVFRQHYDTDALDASTLLIPLVRFLPADDERRAGRPCSRSQSSSRRAASSCATGSTRPTTG